MKCIDAIEGTVKCILNRIHEVSLEDRKDDSEYVRSVKAIIDATDNFIEGNQEIIPDRDLLKNVLYRHSKELWRSTAADTDPKSRPPLAGGKHAVKEPPPSGDGGTHRASTHEASLREPSSPGPAVDGTAADVENDGNDGYRDYYFDYLYRHGIYPR
jgi:hypothetical protein